MANLVSTPRKWRNKTILIKLEATYGVDTTPAGATNWIEARNVSLTPMEVEKVARNIELPYFGNAGSVIGATWAKLSFDVALAASGALGVAPKWGPLMLACCMSETIVAATSVAYNLATSVAPSICGYINIDGVLHKMLGMRGDVKGKMSAKGIPMLSFSYDSVYVAPIAGALPTVMRTGWALEEVVSSANTTPVTINGVPLAFSAFDWSVGNKVTKIDLPGPQREIAITDRDPQASITVLAPDLATFNPFALVDAETIVALSTTHGSAAGKKVKTDMQVRISGVDYDKIDDLVAYKLTLDPVPVAGNDEMTFTCL